MLPKFCLHRTGIILYPASISNFFIAFSTSSDSFLVTLPVFAISSSKVNTARLMALFTHQTYLKAVWELQVPISVLVIYFYVRNYSKTWWLRTTICMLMICSQREARQSGLSLFPVVWTEVSHEHEDPTWLPFHIWWLNLVAGRAASLPS